MFHKYIPHRLSNDWLWHRNNKLATHASVLSHKALYDNPLHPGAAVNSPPFQAQSGFHQQPVSNINEESAMTVASNKESIVKKFGFNSSKGGAVKEKSADLARDFRTFVQDIDGLVRATADLTGEDLEKAKAKLGERISVAKKSLEGFGETIAERASKTATAANTYVHEKPWPVIGASVALGFLAAYLLRSPRE